MNRKFLTATTWVFMALALVFFWLSLRSEEGNMEYTLYALAMVVIAWTTNYFLRRNRK